MCIGKLWKGRLGAACLLDGFLIAGRVFRLGDWTPKQRVLDHKLLGRRGRARLVGRAGAVLQGGQRGASGLKDTVVHLVDKGLLHRWSRCSLIGQNCTGCRAGENLSGLLRLTECACWESVLLLRRSLGQARG